MSRCPGLDETLRFFAASLLLFAVSGLAHAQSHELPDEVFESAGPEPDDASLEALDELVRDAAALRQNPLDVNAAGLGELLRIPGMDPGTALRMVRVVALDGPVTTLDELWQRAGVSPAEAAGLLPYLRVAEAPSTRERQLTDLPGASGRRSEAELRLCVRTSTGPDEHPGANAAFRTRGTVGRDLSWGLALERDAGEPVLLDHVVGFTSWERGTADEGVAVVVGDLVGSWGQGLVLGRGGFGGTSRYPLAADRVRGYDGNSEWTARRGGAASVVRGRLRCEVVVAVTAFDATLEDGLVTSRRTSGLHRTESERAARGAQTEKLVAARVVARGGHWSLGASFASTRFDPGFAEGDSERQRFRFRGEESALGSVDVRTGGRRWRLGAEVARDRDGAAAWLVGGRWRDDVIAVRAGVSFIGRDYWSPTGGGGPGASDGSNGACGWLEVGVRRGRSWSLETSATVSRKPWRTYHEPLPEGRRSVRGALSWRLPAGGRLKFEGRETCSEAREPSDGATSVTRTRRASLTLDGPNGAPFVVKLLSARVTMDEHEKGTVSGIDLRFTSVFGSWALDGGVAVLSSRGTAQRMAHWTGGLPGTMGVTSWQPGLSWWLRLTGSTRPDWSPMVYVKGDGEVVRLGASLEVSRLL